MTKRRGYTVLRNLAWALLAFVAAGIPLTHGLVPGADRIVIRDGGYDCCRTNVDDQTVLMTITNKAEIAAFNKMFRFSRSEMRCRCCGYPGIDWWQGDRKIARAALHHGKALRWKGFAGDARLAGMSRQNMREWFGKRLNADVRYMSPGWNRKRKELSE